MLELLAFLQSSLHWWFFLYFVLFSVQRNFIAQYSAVFLSTLVTSHLVKKGPYENESNHSVGNGLFHLRALLTFYTAQHQMVSFIEWLRP